MKSYVLDSYSVIAFLENEKGADKVSRILADSFQKGINIYFCVLNWGEVYYTALRGGGKTAGATALEAMQALSLLIIDVDIPLTRQAAVFKSKYRMSFADCYAAALAKSVNGILVTGDPEFRQIEKEISVFWID